MTSVRFRVALSNAVLCGTACAQPELSRCDDFAWIPKGRVTFNNNIWNPAVSGHQCIAIYPDATSFNVTWQWDRGDDSNPVHSFPYVRFNSKYLPGRIWDIHDLSVHAAWDMFPTSDRTNALQNVGAVANVAIDMFLDADVQKAVDAKSADYEVMIWLATFGAGMPFGNATGITHATSVQPGQFESFELYKGKKTNGQSVLTWQAANPVRQFQLDVLSFLRLLQTNEVLAPELTLGVVEFGTETFHADENVTFSGSNFSMELSSNASATSAQPFSSSGAFTTTSPLSSMITTI
ncbi:uncharacterized protein PV09_09243 [Verruconis gallopava]|uniref:Uncharacterized protein n=1 Tax=Verruconis gallopava TaxID=253628 RepID=A0A0D1ZY63_9PEZI|nr:uncharacterized protein PV09_09243 [Verruconis gallopava]KIV99014.1 hypothetical protein PV09_09243 [Verruconis gallopava]